MKKRKISRILALFSCLTLLTGCEADALFGLGGVVNDVADWGKGVGEGVVDWGKDILNIDDEEEENKDDEKDHQQEEDKEFVGLSLADQTVTYDGQPHSITISGDLPQGATVSYGTAGNSFTEAGEYQINAVVSCAGYKDLSLSATLTINKAEFQGITFEDASVVYDGSAHEIAPFVPAAYEGAEITYGLAGNSFTEVGEHVVHATVSLANYNDWEGSATLTITKKTFEGLSLQDKNVVYNGEKQTIELTGELPEGATFTYEEGFDGGVEPGTYTIKGVVRGENYADLHLSATLTISSKAFEGLSLEDKVVAYNGEKQTIELSGELPTGATFEYVEGFDGGVEPGTYTIKGVVRGTGYADLQLSATLTITTRIFEGLSLEDETVDFDGIKHSIALTGELPEGATFAYVEGYDGGVEPGVYTIKGVVSGEFYEDLELSATLTIQVPVAQENLLIDDFENIDDFDLNDAWTLEFYNNGWVTPTSANIQIARNEVIGMGEQTMRLNLSHQGSAFKVTKDFNGITKKYGGLAIDTFIDNYVEGGTTKVQLQVWFKDLPLPDMMSGYKDTYVTWTLASACPSNWTHWEIPFDDPSISIAGGAITLAQLQQFGYNLEDFCQYIDQACVLLTPNYVSGGGKSYAYIDNFEFIPARDERLEQQYVYMAGRDYTIASNDGTVFKLSLNETLGARFESLNLENNFVALGQAEVLENKLYFDVSPDGGSHNLHFECDIFGNGAKLQYAQAPTGDVAILAPIADHINFDDKMFYESINIDNFDSYSATGQGYDRGHKDINAVSGLRASYYGEVYNENKPAPGLIEDKWSLINDGSWSTYINLESTGKTGQAMSLTNNSDWQTRYMTFDLARGGAQQYGRGETLSFFVKGNVEQTFKIRVYYVDRITASNQGASSGDCKLVENIPVTTEWSQVNVPLESNRYVYGFMITPTKKNARLYVDDFTLHGEADPNAEYVAPVLFETISDGTYGINTGAQFISVDLANDVTTANINVDGELAGAFTAEQVEGVVTLKDTQTGGLGLTVTFNVEDAGLVVATVDGALKATYEPLIGARLVKVAGVNYDFQNEEASKHVLADPEWIRYVNNGSGYTTTSGQMNVRFSGTNVYCNMTTGSSKGNMYVYKPAGGIGLANHFSVDLANDFSGCHDISAKVKLILADDSEQYLVGDAENFAVIPAGTGSQSGPWHNIDLDFEETFVKAIAFEIFSDKTGGSYDYLYFDNLIVEYKIAEPAPQPKVYANVSYDLQDKAGQVGGNLSDSQWEQKRYGQNGWETLSKAMNVRSADGNVFCNMAVGYSMDYNFIFTPATGAGYADTFSIDLANDYDGAQEIKVKIKLILADDSEIYIAGDGSNYVSIPAGAPKWQHFSTTFEEVNVKSVKLIVKSAKSNGAFLYFDNLVLAHSENIPEPPAVTYANISYDFEDKAGQVGGNLSDSQWEQKRYKNNAWETLSKSMNVRSANGNVYGNMAVGWGMDYVFTYTPTSGAGVANHFSIDLGNDYTKVEDIKVKVKLILADNTEVFIVGDGSNYATIPAGAPKWQKFEVSFDEMDVKAVKLIVKSAMNDTAYLYFDNLLIDYVEPAQTAKYGLVNTNTWDITEADAEFYAWVWDNELNGHWIALEVKTDAQTGAKYFEIDVPADMVGAKVVRVNPNATNKPKADATSYGSYSTDEVWNESADIALSGTSAILYFTF